MKQERMTNIVNDSLRSPSYIPKLQVESRIKSKHRTPYTQGPIKPTKLYDGKMWCNRAQIQLQLCPSSMGIYTAPLLPKHSSPGLHYQSEVFRMNEKITVLASVLVRPEIGDIWILRGIVKESTQTGGDRRRCTGDPLPIFKHRWSEHVEVMLDFSVAPGNKSRTANWKQEGGIFRKI